jgi:hypothetical protein
MPGLAEHWNSEAVENKIMGSTAKNGLLMDMLSDNWFLNPN